MLASMVALVSVSADAGGRTSSPRNGRIVFAAGARGVAELAAADLRSGRTAAVRKGAFWGEVSPDGHFVAIVQNIATSGWSVLVVRRDGKSSPLRLGDGYDPTWSPSSRRLAYIRAGSGLDDSRLRVVNRDGSGPSEIYAGRIAGPRWSPDGAWIAFVVGLGSPVPAGLYVIRPDGSGLHLLAANTFFYEYGWSPDGRRVVFVRARMNPGLDIFIVPVEGGHETRLTNDTRGKFGPTWSPNGALIAFYTNDDGTVMVIDPEGSNERVVGEGYEPSWSSDGRLCYLSGDGIRVARLNGRSPRLAVHKAMGSQFDRPRWLPGNRGLAYVRYVEAGGDLYSMRAGGADLRRLTPRLVQALDPAAAPGRQVLAFARVRPAGNREIAVIRTSGRGFRTLTHNPFGWDHEPTWSPDGRRIAFVRALSVGRAGLYVVPGRGGKARLLSAVDHPDHPAWSPDGKRIAVDASPSSTTPGIRLLDLATKSVEVVTQPADGFDLAASWSPDGSTLAYVRRIYGGHSPTVREQFRLLTLATGEDRAITDFLWSTNSCPFEVRWSPDGKFLAGISSDGGPSYAPCVVVTMNPDGSNRRVIWSKANVLASGVSWASR